MNKMIVIIFLGSVLKTLGSGTPGGWVIGWGDNVAGEATGICPFVVSTNQDIMLKQYKDMSLRTSLGAMVAVNSQPLTNIIAISAGASHCLALKGDYTVVAWGWNGGGKTVIPTGLTNVVALSAGNMHSLALRQDGTVVGWGQSGNAALNIPAGLNKMVAVATACGDNSLALKNDGTVVGWGQSVKTPLGLSNVVAIATDPNMYLGINHPGQALALKRDGTVVEFVWTTQSVHSRIVEGLTDAVAIATGPVHNLAIRKDGTVFCWGFNGNAKLNPPAGLSNVVSVAVSGTSFPADGYSLALKSDGQIVAWSRMHSFPVTVPEGLSNVVAMAAGPNYCLAITTNRAVAERFRQH